MDTAQIGLPGKVKTVSIREKNPLTNIGEAVWCAWIGKKSPLAFIAMGLPISSLRFEIALLM